MSQRFEGKSLEEALTLASEALGIERARLTYHVVMEKRGFLGGVKQVLIEAEENVAAAEPVQRSSATRNGSAAVRGASGQDVDGNVHTETRPPRPRAGAGRERGRDRGRGNARGNGRGGNREGGRGQGGSRGGQRGGQRGSESSLRSGDFEQFMTDEIPQQGPESENAKTVRSWLEEVLDIARLHIDVRTEENDERIQINLYGRDSRRLLEENGELLDALQVLANKSLTGRKVEKDIELDSHRFKARRAEDLAQRAQELAEKVRRDGREQLFPAMTPIERRIVHIALQEDADVTTESRGEGFFKRVAVIRRPVSVPGEVSTEP